MTRTEHLLTILAEECAEVAQRVSKALRFGLAEVQPGQRLTNAERVEAELTDLLAAVEMLVEERVIADPGVNDLAKRMKKAKVEKFLKFSAGRGLVDGVDSAPVPHPEEVRLCDACKSPRKPDGTCSRSQCYNSE